MRPATPTLRALLVLMVASGAAALSYEVLWMRRFALLFGGGAVAVTLTVATLFGGLGLGGLLGGRARVRDPARAYARLEGGAAAWAVAMPWMLTALTPWVRANEGLGVQAAVVAALAGPPAVALGATLPVLARSLDRREAVASLYAANTTGAVAGVLAVPAVLLPLLGVRGAELLAAGTGGLIALVAWRLGPFPVVDAPPTEARARRRPLIAVGLAGLAAMALEVAWTRLAAVLLGPSIHAFAWVLAVFLAGIALGAGLGRRLTGPRVLSGALGAMGVLALIGAQAYGQAPLWLAGLYGRLGPSGMGLVEASLAAVTMGGAPVASGVVFARALAEAGGGAGRATGRVYSVNTLAGVVGSAATGLWLLPWLGVQGVVALAATLCAAGAALLGRQPTWILACAVLVYVAPDWDGKLYAVGVYNRVSDLGDRSPEAVRAFAEEGWGLVSYADGRTAAVAVGRSERTGNVWLSINGKVDASTGEDMPTQVLSGQLPVRMVRDPARALVVGLASGVTAGAVLDEPGVEALTVVELEEEVVAASHHFDHVNGRPLEDPRTTLLVRDARAVLAQDGPPFDVIVSEPSNPWITGVSNLFTLEYWQLGRARLAPGGAFCQWVQIYGLHPDHLRSLVATFTQVFPEAWLFEPIPGADLLLIGGEGLSVDDLPLGPRLDPAGVRRLGLGAPLNTDDHPRVELGAPRSIHLATAEANEALLDWAAGG
ncbi:MAG: hypothetical protein H6739_38715 [Alphaproteobacteria bacterium]|nr:hypothetical protein [Alphaproteobacteria bacterium]